MTWEVQVRPLENRKQYFRAYYQKNRSKKLAYYQKNKLKIKLRKITREMEVVK